MAQKLEHSYSFIIPVKSLNDYIRETISHILKFENDAWDIIILPNDIEKDEWQDNRIRIIATGKISPARKRDIGAKQSTADILVFIDDDSYPEKNLLEIADQNFVDEKIIALGGPGITPPQDSFWQKVSGAVFLSKLSGGFPERYISLGKPKPVLDWPSVNLLIRRDVFLNVGGFDNDFWPGEDTYFCLKLIQNTGKPILYVPDMVVWHHRRAGLFQHLKQIGAYATNRGFFAKVYPENSRKLIFFIPTFFVFFVVASLLTPIFSSKINYILITGWAVYLLGLLFAFIEIQRYEKIKIAIVALLYILLTHIFYGSLFLVGLLSSKPHKRLR